MPPKTSRAGRPAPSVPRPSASGRATRSQTRQPPATPGGASTLTPIAAKADLASAPSFAYGSGGKALAPARPNTEIRNKSRSEILQNALKDSKRSLEAQRTPTPSPRMKQSSSEVERETEVTKKARSNPMARPQTPQRSEQAYEGSSSPSDEENESLTSDEAEIASDEEQEERGIEGQVRPGKSVNDARSRALKKGPNTRHIQSSPAAPPVEVSSMSFNPLRWIRRRREQDSDTASFAERSMSYFAEGMVSGTAGVMNALWASIPFRLLLILCFLGLAYFSDLSGVSAKVSHVPSALRNLLPATGIADTANETALRGLAKEIQSIGARMSRLERRADQQYSSVLAAASAAAATSFSAPSSLDEEDVGQAVNFFAPNSGVAIDPYLTSPTRAPASYSAFQSWQRWLLPYTNPGPQAPGPATAFAPWSDAGDCWCAADAHGRSQLVALLGRAASVRELVVEHVPRSATLDPGATPRGVQLLVQIVDPDLRERAALAVMDHVGPVTRDGRTAGVAPGWDGLDKSWIVVAQGEFDFAGANVQRFKVAPGLENLGVHVRKVAVRTLGNWGDGQGKGTDHVCLYRLKLLGAPQEMTSHVSRN